VLITEYFQQIESQLADCVHILEIETFPHHKHIQSNKLKATSPPALVAVLDEIVDLLS